MDDRSGIDSQGSQRISTNMTGNAADRDQIFNMYLLKPEQVGELWEHADPNSAAQKLILAHVEDVSE